MYKPKTAVLITPIGVGMGDGEWDVVIVVDIARFGDVLGFFWELE